MPFHIFAKNRFRPEFLYAVAQRRKPVINKIYIFERFSLEKTRRKGYNEIKKAMETDPSIKATIEVLKKKINPN